MRHGVTSERHGERDDSAASAAQPMDTEEAGWINMGEVASGDGVGQFLRGVAKEIGYKAHTDFEGRLAAPRQTEQQDSAASEATGTAAVTMEVEQGGSAAPAATGAAAAVTGAAAATTMEVEQQGSAASAATTTKWRSAATREKQGKRRNPRQRRRDQAWKRQQTETHRSLPNESV